MVEKEINFSSTMGWLNCVRNGEISPHSKYGKFSRQSPRPDLYIFEFENEEVYNMFLLKFG